MLIYLFSSVLLHVIFNDNCVTEFVVFLLQRLIKFLDIVFFFSFFLHNSGPLLIGTAIGVLLVDNFKFQLIWKYTFYKIISAYCEYNQKKEFVKSNFSLIQFVIHPSIASATKFSSKNVWINILLTSSHSKKNSSNILKIFHKTYKH